MTALDPKVIEAAARELATEHYAYRFEKPADDPHVRANVDANWNVFVPALERHVGAYLTHAVPASDHLTAALVALARHNIPTDVQELLLIGDPMRNIPPGALAAAMRASALAKGAA